MKILCKKSLDILNWMRVSEKQSVSLYVVKLMHGNNARVHKIVESVDENKWVAQSMDSMFSETVST